jgi:hypothetical protein
MVKGEIVTPELWSQVMVACVAITVRLPEYTVPFNLKTRLNVPFVTDVNETIPIAGAGSAEPLQGNKSVELKSHSNTLPFGVRLPPQFRMGEWSYDNCV